MKKKKKKATVGKAKTARKRSTARDLPARKAGSVKGGLLPAVKSTSTALNVSDTSLSLGDGSVRPLGSSITR